MQPLNSKDKEEYLAQIDDGERSEDDFEESGAEEHEDFYENREDLRHDLESLVEEKNDECGDDPLIAEDPPLINETPVDRSASGSIYLYKSNQSPSIYEKPCLEGKKFVLNSDQTAFLGSTTYPPELRMKLLRILHIVFFPIF